MMEVLVQNQIHNNNNNNNKKERKRARTRRVTISSMETFTARNRQIAKNDSNGVKCITQFVASTIAAIFTPKQHLETQA